LGVWVRGQKLADLINAMNQLPAESRRVHVQVVEQKGKLRDTGNYFIELYDIEQNYAAGSIEKFDAKWEKGDLNVSASVSLKGLVKVHGHYKPLKTGAKVGVDVAVEPIDIRAKVDLEKSSTALFDAKLNIETSAAKATLASSIKDSKDACVRVEYKCFGTWRDPVRTCEYQKCVRLWDYEIPFSISVVVPAGKSVGAFPVVAKLPDQIVLQKEVDGFSFKKAIKLSVTPDKFVADEKGLLLQTRVTVSEVK